jgi:hypothetical protein
MNFYPWLMAVMYVTLSKGQNYLDRINQGALFIKKGTIKPTQHVFLTAFILDDPTEYSMTNNYLTLNCKPIVKLNDFDTRKELCDYYQVPISKLNRRFKLKYNMLKDISDDTKLLRGKRSTNNNKMHRYTRNLELHNFDNKTSDRVKRETNIVGDIMSTFFSLATKNQVKNLAESISKSVRENREYIRKNNKIIRGLTSTVHVLDKNIKITMEEVAENTKAINNMMSDVKEIIWDLNRISHLTSVNAHSIRYTLNLTTNILTDGIELDDSLDILINNFKAYRQGLIHLSDGKMDPIIIKPSELKDLIEEIDIHVMRSMAGYHVVQRDIAYYYTYSKAHLINVHNTNVVVMELDIERDTGVDFEIYQTVPLYMPIHNTRLNEESYGFTEIRNMAEYFCVSLMGQSFELDHETYSSCETIGHTNEYKCPTRLVIGEPQHMTCTKAIYQNSPKNIQKYCKLNYLAKNFTLEPSIYDLDDGRVLISGLQNDEVIMSCGTVHKTLPVYHLMLLNLSCSCDLMSTEFYISQNSYGCHHFTIQENFTQYPINIPALMLLSNKSYDYSYYINNIPYTPIQVDISPINTKFIPIVHKHLLKGAIQKLDMEELAEKYLNTDFKGSPIISTKDIDNILKPDSWSIQMIAIVAVSSIAGICTLVIITNLIIKCMNKKRGNANIECISLTAAGSAGAIPTAEAFSKGNQLDTFELAIEIAGLMVLFYLTYLLIMKLINYSPEVNRVMNRKNDKPLHQSLLKTNIYLILRNQSDYVTLYLSSLKLYSFENLICTQFALKEKPHIYGTCFTRKINFCWNELQVTNSNLLIKLPKIINLTFKESYKITSILKTDFQYELIYGNNGIYVPVSKTLYRASESVLTNHEIVS